MEKNTSKKPFGFSKLIVYICLILLAITIIVPVAWVFLASVKQNKEFYGNPWTLPEKLYFQNFVDAWTKADMGSYILNSVIVTALAIAMLIAVALPAAYVLSRFDFIANKFIQTSFVSAMGVPAIMVVLPLFSIISGMGILNNVAAGRTVLIILYVGINVPYTTIFLLTFFSNISRTYEEAAAIDGCPPMRTFWKIMFPMAQSGIVTVTIFNFINIWNEYFLSLIFASSDKLKPVAPGLYGMINSMKYTGDWAGMFAAVIIVFLPTFILYIFLSEKIIGGVTGGIKG